MMMEIKNLTYLYNKGTPFEKTAIDNISLNIYENEFIGLIGHTGSGKSTFVQHLNALIKPTSGQIMMDGYDITEEGLNLTKVRENVGLVFQYPEYQLFEEDIYKDIAFGPKNLDLSEEEIDERVKWSMDLVGLDFETMKDRSPFEISGGQKRRVAIAGVLAMKPKVLILDEPTAGLDPHGRDEILGQIGKLYEVEDMTIILVSHSMEDVAKLANRVIVLDKGKVAIEGPTREIFKETDKLESVGLGVPQITKFMQEFKSLGNDIDDDILTVEEAKTEMIKYLRGKENV